MAWLSTLCCYMELVERGWALLEKAWAILGGIWRGAIGVLVSLFPFLRNPKLYFEALPFIAAIYLVTFVFMDENPFIMAWEVMRIFIEPFHRSFQEANNL